MCDRKAPPKKDRVLADTGWGIKPDVQPSNKDEVRDPQRSFQYQPGNRDSVKQALRVQQRNFNVARRVIVERGRSRIIDINRDEFVIEGLSFGDGNLIFLLEELGAAFNAPALRALGPDFDGVREYDLTQRFAWGSER